MRSSKASGVSWSTRRALMFVPAAATSACSGPSAARRSARAATAARSVTSRRWATTSRPAAASSISSGRRAAPCTCAPASAKASAVARPMPLEAPVTSAVRPSSGAHAQASRPAPARKTLTVAGGGPCGEAREGVGPIVEWLHRRQLAHRRARRRPATRAPARSRPWCRRRSRAARAGRARPRGSPAWCRRRRGRCTPPARRGAGARAPWPASPARRRRRGRGRRRAPRSRPARRRAPRRGRRRPRARPARARARRRCVCGSRTLTCSMSDSSAAWRVIRPIVPAPITTARPTGSPASPRRTAWTPLASGSTSAPARAVTSSGSARTLAAGAVTRSAKAPSWWTPIRVRRGHRFSWPAAHSRQLPHPASGLTVTRAPSHAPAPAPAATTTPANSWPITSGGVRLPMWPR